MENMLLIKRREAIILAAIDAIDRCGIQAVSTREIAKRQGVSERIIFKHFPTKNQLISGVLEYFEKYDNAIIQTTQTKQMNPLESITYFFESFSLYYENYPAITSITQSFDALLRYPDLDVKVKEIFNKHALFVKEKIEEAQKQGFLVFDIQGESIADIILGTFMRLCLKWRMNEYAFSLRETTLSALQIIIKSFSA